MGRQPDAEGAADDGRARRYIVWATLLALALMPFVFIEGPGAGLLRSLGLIDRNESFSELYFPGRTVRPVTAVAGAPLTFDFSVRNREGAPTTYRWQVRLGPVGSETAGLAHGLIRLGDREARTVHVDALAPGPPGPTTVSVVLVGRSEAIHFPLTITPG